MTKKLLVLSFLLAIFSFANASITDPVPKVDPEKKDQKATQKKNIILKENKLPSNAFEEDYRAYKAKDEIVPYHPVEARSIKKEEIKKEEDASGTNSTQDVQSFNFLYYIIHHFKFSDFISE